MYHNENFDNNWKKIPSMLNRRCGHSAITTLNGNIVALGGYEGGEGNDGYLKTVEIFDVGKDIWYYLPDMCACRTGAGTAMGPNGCIFVCGGSANGEAGSDSFEMLDMRQGKWINLPSSSTLRGYTQATFVSCSQLYLTGGITSQFQNNATTIDIYDVIAGKWFQKSTDKGAINYELLNRNSHNCLYIL